ncbi:hypothetical protein [Halopseudomonas sp.]|uniref:hypothetical protein n=1 Tax=Halopseudomonas sp. TaxID=2901191 RepID=UPI0030025B34
MQSKFKTYSDIKKKLSGLTYKGVDICGPASAILANIIFSKKSDRKKYRGAIKLLWRKPKHTYKNELTGHILTWNNPRIDHKKNAEQITKRISSPKAKFRLVHIPDIQADYKNGTSLKILFEALKITRSTQVEKKHFLYVLAAVTYTIRQYETLIKHKIPEQIKTLIAYNSSNIPECFLTTLCRSYKIPTFSIQHALYQSYKNEVPLDVINYENVTAETLLVWSTFCKNQILEFYDRENRTPNFKMPIAGYLKKIKPLAYPSTTNTNHSHILCLLPRDETSSSISLLEILKTADTSQRFIIRLHPISDKEKIIPGTLPGNFIIDTSDSIDTTLESNKISLAVGFNSTSIFDVLLYDIPCAIYDAPDCTLKPPGIPTFKTLQELRIILSEKHSGLAAADYILGATISKYTEIVAPELDWQQE